MPHHQDLYQLVSTVISKYLCMNHFSFKSICIYGRDVPCECYTRNCTQDETCADKYNGGVCSIPSPGRDYKPTDYYCRDTQVAEVGETPEDRDLCESER